MTKLAEFAHIYGPQITAVVFTLISAVIGWTAICMTFGIKLFA